ncbi:ketosteroid isomerase-like protein, partial [Mycena rosella]
PTKTEIRAIFAPLSVPDGDAFFVHVADDVHWTVMGHHPLAGRYTSKQAFIDGTFQRLGRTMKQPIKLVLQNVVGGGQENHGVVELKAVAVCKNGLDFDNRYAWVVKFNLERKIVQVHAYLDSELVKRALEENE